MNKDGRKNILRLKEESDKRRIIKKYYEILLTVLEKELNKKDYN